MAGAFAISSAISLTARSRPTSMALDTTLWPMFNSSIDAKGGLEENDSLRNHVVDRRRPQWLPASHSATSFS